MDGQMSIFDFLEADPVEWERFRDEFCSRQGGFLRFDSQGKLTDDKSYEVVKACCFTPKNIKEPWDNWRPCCYEACEFLEGKK